MHPILSEHIAQARREELLAAAARRRHAPGGPRRGGSGRPAALPGRVRAGVGWLLIRAGTRLAGQHAHPTRVLRLRNAS